MHKQGLLLTFEGERSNWQWKDETHSLVGTLIYIGSAVTLVFGIQSETWGAAAFGAELQERLKAMIIVAHAGLLGKMAITSKPSSGSVLQPSSPPVAAGVVEESSSESKKAD